MASEKLIAWREASHRARDRVQKAVLGVRLVRPTPENPKGWFSIESPSGIVLGRGPTWGAAWQDAEAKLNEATGRKAGAEG